MPELPEVETIVRRLRTCVVGLRIQSVQVSWPRIVAVPDVDRFRQDLRGKDVLEVNRRGKYIVISLAPAGFLCAHLRMTGRLVFVPVDAVNHPLITDLHCHAVFTFTTGDRLYFRDTRKFGRLYLVQDPDEITAGLGIEPLDDRFTTDALAALMYGRHRQLKPALLDQSRIAGLGNIYVDESLWLARLHPLRQCSSLEQGDIRCLHAAIIEVLNCALENHGTTLRDYRDPDERPGDNKSCLEVYGRTGEPCSRCGTPIERIIVAQRSSHICPLCQR